jgi:mono/diheme cytochrome c family protein
MRPSIDLCVLAASLVLLAAPTAFSAEVDGAALYKAKCSLCHGKDGQPTPSFAKKGVQNHQDAEWQKATTDEAIRSAIAEGSKGTLMRAYERELTPEQIDALVAHIRSLGKQPE